MSTACTQLQLVRNSYNLPQDETDGFPLFPANWNVPGAPPVSMTPLGDMTQYQSVSATTQISDSGARPGVNYYSMFGWDSVNLIWIRCSDLMAILPVDWGYGTRLYSLLPAAYQDRDMVLVDPYNPWPQNTPGQPPLQRYLNLIGFELDFIRTELESLTVINDSQNLSGALLPLMGYELGLRNEPEIGMQQYRSLVQNAIHLYKLKGSSAGITEFTTTLTSYPTLPVHHGYNMLLTLDDSVMATSTGTWQAFPPAGSGFGAVGGSNSGLSLTQVPNLMTVSGMTNPTSIIGFEPPGYNSTGGSYSGMAVAVSGASIADIVTGAIPVLDFLSSTGTAGHVTFTLQVWSPVTARTVEMSIVGDTGSGVPITVAAASTFTSTFHAWKQNTITATIDPFNPANLAADGSAQYDWLYPRIRVLGMAAGEIHYFTLIMLWACRPTDVGVNTPVYDYPRDLKIVLQPQAANLFSNPLTTFNHGFDGWVTSANPRVPNLLTPNMSSLESGVIGTDWGNTSACTLTASTADAHVGTHSLRMISTAASGPMYCEGPTDLNRIPVIPGQVLTATAWVKAALTVEPCHIAISYYTSTLTSVTGSGSTAVTDSTSAWTQLSVTMTVPATAAYAVLYLSVDNLSAINEVHYWDDIALYVGPFISTNPTADMSIRTVAAGDASGAFAVNGTASLQLSPNPGGVVWGGTVNAFSPTPTASLGWYVDPNQDWFGGTSVVVGANRPWFDPVNGWFIMNQQYFNLGSAQGGGDWFKQVYPTVYNNLVGFQPAAGQFFNVSIYARYMAVRLPADAAMLFGFRWYFPDGTFAESSTTVTLTQTFTRYDLTAQVPYEALVGSPSNLFYTFFRFPNAQSGDIFLLNSAMLSPNPATGAPPYFDTTLFPGNADYVIDSHGASYYYRRRGPRNARLNAELYRWIPMGSTYTNNNGVQGVIFGAGAVQPPLDPTKW